MSQGPFERCSDGHLSLEDWRSKRVTKQAVGKGAERRVPESSLLEPSVAPAGFFGACGKDKRSAPLTLYHYCNCLHLASTNCAIPTPSSPLTTSRHHPATTNHDQLSVAHLPGNRKSESSTSNNRELTSPAWPSPD